uniref:Gluzincin n=1 Tax=Rhipicephalus zambeziensis TaxID=60191 RepID=A0A224Y7X5_9ACAR
MLFSSSVGTAVSLWINLSIIRCTHGEAGKSVPLPSESPAPCENFYRHVCNFKSAERDSTNLDYYVDGDSDELDDIIPATEQKLRKMLYTKIEALLIEPSIPTSVNKVTAKTSEEDGKTVKKMASQIYQACLKGKRYIVLPR